MEGRHFLFACLKRNEIWRKKTMRGDFNLIPKWLRETGGEKKRERGREKNLLCAHDGGRGSDRRMGRVLEGEKGNQDPPAYLPPLPPAPLAKWLPIIILRGRQLSGDW